MNEAPATPLTVDEIEQFNALLGKLELEDDYELSLEEVHGFITGIICGPKIMAPFMWLPEIFDGLPIFESEDETKQFHDYIERIYNQTAICLESNKPLPQDYFPAHPENLVDDYDYEAIAAWCTGFHDAITLDEDWEESEFFFAMLLPMLISMSEEDSEMLKDFSNDANQKPIDFKNRMISHINNSVESMFYYFWNLKFRFGGGLKEDSAENELKFSDDENTEEEVTLH